MERTNGERVRNGVEAQLTTLMRSVVDARARIGHARERLHYIEHKLRKADPDSYERQREKALGDYIDAMGKARLARTQLLKQLRARAA
jgi:division protein CdvB (Snf7/Vps24/ESCRT-III family)